VNIKKLIIYSTIILNLFSCNKKSPVILEDEKQIIKNREISIPVFTLEEKAYINKLKEKGYLSVVSHLMVGSFEEKFNGTFSGFQYDLTKEFADFLDIDFKIQTVLFSELFSKDGAIPDRIKTDPAYTYDPDIFNKADLNVSFLTILPWRQQIMDMIPYLPAKEMFVSRADNPIRELTDLEGKIIGYGIGSSYEHTLLQINNRLNNSLTLKSFPFEENILKDISEGSIDGTVLDLQNLLISLQNYPNLVAELPASDIEHVAWGVKKGNNILAGIIQKFFKYTHEAGIMDGLFKKNYNVQIEKYYSLIEYDGVELYQLDLTQSEIKWLEKKRETGKIIIGTISAEDIYKVEDDGTINGFDYYLAKNFAQTLGLKLEVQLQEDITSFFSKDGVFDNRVVTDPTIIYTPDLLNKVDIYAAPFTILPWREKLLKTVPMMPMGQVLAGRVGEEIDDIIKLDGKKLAVIPGSYQETLITEIMKEKNFSVEFSYMETYDDPLNFVKDRKADYVIDGAVYVAKGMKNLDGIVVSPIKFDRLSVGWPVRRDNIELITILEKYFNKSLDNGVFRRLWKEANGVDFDYYLNLIKE